MIGLEEIEKLAKEKPIEEVLENFGWKEFEEVVAEIFRRHEFFVRRNFRLKTRKRYEIDIVAVKSNFVFCIDCKRWLGGRYKKSAIKRSAKEQEKRTRVMKRFLEKNPILRESLKIASKFEIIPLILTLMEEDLIKEGNTFIVPLFKLNSFLLEFESYL
ncbi:MAG: NERD domain-containing protein [Candidatus Aenigmatarchaeota archaeon]